MSAFQGRKKSLWKSVRWIIPTPHFPPNSRNIEFLRIFMSFLYFYFGLLGLLRRKYEITTHSIFSTIFSILDLSNFKEFLTFILGSLLAFWDCWGGICWFWKFQHFTYILKRILDLWYFVRVLVITLCTISKVYKFVRTFVSELLELVGRG